MDLLIVLLLSDRQDIVKGPNAQTIGPRVSTKPEGRNSPLWKRGVRGDFGKIGLVNYEGFVKSLFCPISVIPAKAGIQGFL